VECTTIIITLMLLDLLRGWGAFGTGKAAS
jgi:hypothetical protein